MLNREELRDALYKRQNPLDLIPVIRRLGYIRGRFSNGIEVITIPDGSDYIHQPTSLLTFRNHHAWKRAWEKLPFINMKG